MRFSKVKKTKATTAKISSGIKSRRRAFIDNESL
jgi:hypothetical protein